MLRFFLILNIAVFLAMGIDKFLAGKAKIRLSEAAILLVSAFGAGPGLVAAIFFFRHKTQKKLFVGGALLALLTSVGVFVLTHGR